MFRRAWMLLLAWVSLTTWACLGGPKSRTRRPLIPYVLKGEVDDRLVQLAMKGIRQNYNMELEEAENTFQTMISEFPRHPAGYMCMGGLLEFRMEFENDDSHQKRFNDAVKASLAACRQEDREGREICAFFFKGGTLGYRGYNRGRRNNWLAAVRDGKGMARCLKKVLKMDPFCYDAFLGLGLYEYYVSKYKSKLDFLPFIGDKREEGIRKLEICVQRAALTSIPARASLMWIFYDEERYDEAYRVAKWFNGNCPAYWDAYNVQGAARRKQGRLQEAAEAYGQGIEALASHLPDKDAERVRFHMKRADVFSQMESYEDAIQEYAKVVEWPICRQEKDAKRVENMKQQAKKHIQGLEAHLP